MDMNADRAISSSDIYAQIHKIRVRRRVRCIAGIALLAAALGAAYGMFGLYRVKGGSMYPTLMENDIVVYRRGAFEPKRGDIVVIQSELSPSGYMIKRVIATGGDVVQVDVAGRVRLNGEALQEDYAQYADEGGAVAETSVQDGCCFVMGDNRGDSQDSRDAGVGELQSSLIQGKAVLVIRTVRHGLAEAS